MSEGRDWFELVASGARCPDCGLDASAVARAELGPSLLGEARRWEDTLGALAVDDAALRRRPAPGVWSAIEYAAHVAGVLAVFAHRVRRCRLEDQPELGWWDHESAAEEERYGEQPVEQVRAGIADGAVTLALALPRLDDPAGWARLGTRRGSEPFSVEGLVRFALHEAVHHRLDAERSAGATG